MNALAPPELPDTAARVRRLRGPLLDELLATPPEQQRHQRRPGPRRRHRWASVAAAAAFALLIALTASLATRGADSALAVERRDGWFVLRIADVSAGAEKLTQELRDAGISGEVRLLPVAEADVGTWAIISERADPPGTPRAPIGNVIEETVRLNDIERSRDTLRIPIATVRESTGYFVFYAGREAKPGEPLMRDGDFRYVP